MPTHVTERTHNNMHKNDENRKKPNTFYKHIEKLEKIQKGELV